MEKSLGTVFSLNFLYKNCLIFHAKMFSYRNMSKDSLAENYQKN